MKKITKNKKLSRIVFNDQKSVGVFHLDNYDAPKDVAKGLQNIFMSYCNYFLPPHVLNDEHYMRKGEKTYCLDAIESDNVYTDFFRTVLAHEGSSGPKKWATIITVLLNPGHVMLYVNSNDFVIDFLNTQVEPKIEHIDLYHVPFYSLFSVTDFRIRAANAEAFYTSESKYTAFLQLYASMDQKFTGSDYFDWENQKLLREIIEFPSILERCDVELDNVVETFAKYERLQLNFFAPESFNNEAEWAKIACIVKWYLTTFNYDKEEKFINIWKDVDKEIFHMTAKFIKGLQINSLRKLRSNIILRYLYDNIKEERYYECISPKYVNNDFFYNEYDFQWVVDMDKNVDYNEIPLYLLDDLGV